MKMLSRVCSLRAAKSVTSYPCQRIRRLIRFGMLLLVAVFLADLVAAVVVLAVG